MKIVLEDYPVWQVQESIPLPFPLPSDPLRLSTPTLEWFYLTHETDTNNYVQNTYK